VKNYIIPTIRTFEVMGDKFNIKNAVHVFAHKKSLIKIIMITIIFVRLEVFTVLILSFLKSVLNSKFCL